MKIYIFSAAITLVMSTSTFADFGLIYDKDGYVNLREEMNLNSKIIGTVDNNEVISCILEEKKSKFCFVNLDSGRDGYIFKDRVNFFKDYKKIVLNNSTQNTSVFKGDGVEVNIYAKNFNSDKIEFIKEGGGYYLGGKMVFGTDNAVPNKDYLQLEKIEIKHDDRDVIIPYDILKGYFFPRKSLDGMSEISKFNVYIKGQDLYLVNQFNSGGAGAYNVIFHIKNNKLNQIKAWGEQI